MRENVVAVRSYVKKSRQNATSMPLAVAFFINNGDRDQ